MGNSKGEPRPPDKRVERSTELTHNAGSIPATSSHLHLTTSTLLHRSGVEVVVYEGGRLVLALWCRGL